MKQPTLTAFAARLLRLLVIPLLLAGSGCTAYTLSGLHSESDQLQTSKASCQAGTQGAVTDPTLCLTSLDAPLLDLAQRSRDGAAQASDERTRIGFLAISALSGWSSLTPEGAQLADDVAADGVQRCAALDPKTNFVPPRDCNLMALEPGFARHSRAVIFLTRIGHMPQPDPATLTELHDQASSYVGSTWDFIEAKRAELKDQGTLNADIAAYLDRQRLALFCGAHRFSILADKFDDAALDPLLADIDNKMRRPFGFRPEMCTPSMFGLS
jgi:hypothetical protein